MNAIKMYFLDVLTHHYVDFKGRATRKQFLLPILGGLVLFVFYLLPSTEGENRFGANN